MYLTQPQPDFNTFPQRSREDEALRAKLLQLGRLIHQCGERPTAELFAECTTLPPDIRDELITRLQDFTRLSPELYKATGADRFLPYLISIPGGRP